MDKRKRVFCNDLCVLNAVFPHFDDALYEIVTESPNIHASKMAVSLNDRISPDKLVELTRDLYGLCTDIYEALKEKGYEYDAYSLMFALTCEQNFLKKAASIQKSDFETGIIVTKIDATNPSPRYSNDYVTLFRDHGDCEIRSVKLADIKTTEHFHFIQAQKTNKVLDFLKAFSLNVRIYPLVTPLWPLLKRVWPRLDFIEREGVALIEENQITRSICTKLSLEGRGFSFVKGELTKAYRKGAPEFSEEAEARYQKIESVVFPKVEAFLNSHIEEKVLGVALDYMQDKIRSAHYNYYTSYKVALGFVDKNMSHKKALLSNMLKNPVEYGLAVACREKGIKSFCFQHGICREISPHFDYIPQITESNLPDYFITNTKKGAEVSVGFPFTMAQCHAVGITKDHYAGKSFVKHPDLPEVFYISTNVYTSNTGFIKAGGDDKLAYDSEVFVIDDILSQVNKDILYKAYPTQKYLDADPCYEKVLKHKNLKLYLEEKDLRYISKHARVLISSKATSTFNWCFLTDKPFIFFDHPYLAPLRKELISVFRDMLFYFDLTEEGVAEKVRELLDKPIEDIEALYNAKDKKEARRKFITENYYDVETGAEKRAYEFVKQKAFAA